MRRLFAALCSLVVLSACGDDATNPLDTTDLTLEEIEALFTELGSAFSRIGSPSAAPSPSQDGLQAAPVEFEVAIDQTIPCDTGVMTLIGTSGTEADSETGAFTTGFDFTWGFSACVIESLGTATVYTLNSAPGIEYITNIAFDPAASTFTSDGINTGGIRIQTADGRDGVCVFDVSYSSSANTSTGAASTSLIGTVCGVDVNSITSYSVATAG